MSAARPLSAALLTAAVTTAGVLVGVLAGRAAVIRAQAPFRDLGPIAEVFGTIEREYYEPVSAQTLTEAAIGGMVDALDPQSRWLTPDQLAAIRDEATGTRAGLGIEVTRTGQALQIVEVTPESPAARGGLAEGDRIVAVDGQPVDGLDPDALRTRLTGTVGRTTELTVLRDGWAQPRTVTAAQAPVHPTTTRGALLPDGVAYVRIDQFQRGTADDLQAVVAALGRVEALILDLRDNPGGLLSEAVQTADLFLDEGPIVTTRVRGAPDTVHAATPGGFPGDLDVIVLVNGGSASASEIVAGALQDTGRGRLVGEPTYGKGTVQEVYVPGDGGGAALKLTVGQYYTPSGAPVAPREGRRPDRIVPAAPGSGHGGDRGGHGGVELESDPQVQAAWAWMTAS